jgi:hypothetical protein
MKPTPCIVLWADFFDADGFPHIEGQVPQDLKDPCSFGGLFLYIRPCLNQCELMLTVAAARDTRPLLITRCASVSEAKSVGEYFAVNMLATFDQIKDRNRGE